MIMKITGVMVDMMVDIDPTEYGPKVVYENGKKVLYLEVLKAIYGMLIAALLWFHKLRKDLGEFGFKFNPYEPCVGNKIVDAKQQTVRFHVDDLMSSHVDPKSQRQVPRMAQQDVRKIRRSEGDKRQDS